MSKKQAFPLITWSFPNGAQANVQAGMTLREYYAGLALQGLIAGDSNIQYGISAVQAVAHADALIAELEGAKP